MNCANITTKGTESKGKHTFSGMRKRRNYLTFNSLDSTVDKPRVMDGKYSDTRKRYEIAHFTI